MVTRRVTSRVTAPTARRVTGNGVSGGSFDVDARAWFDAVEATGAYFDLTSTESFLTASYVKRQFDTWFKGCKSDGIFDAIKDGAFFVGIDSLAGILIKFVGRDAAFGNDNFDADDYNPVLGLKGNKTDKRLRTNRNANAFGSQDNRSLAVFVTEVPSVMATLCHAGTGPGSGLSLLRNHTSSFFPRVNSSTSPTLPYNYQTKDLIGASRDDADNVKWSIGAITGEVTQASTTPITSEVTVFSAGDLYYSDGRLAAYFQGEDINLQKLNDRTKTLVQSLKEPVVGRLAFNGIWNEWIEPLMVADGNDTYVGDISSAGYVKIRKFNANMTQTAEYPLAKIVIDDHNPPAILLGAGDDEPTMVFYANHGTETKLYYHISTTSDLADLGPQQELSFSVAATYVQLFRRASDGRIIVFCRQRTTDDITQVNWAYKYSDDDGATWSAQQNWLNGEYWAYHLARWKTEGEVLAVAAHVHPSSGSNQDIFYCEIDLDTGDITKPDGTDLGNFWISGELPISLTNLDVVRDPSGTRRSRLFHLNQHREIIFAEWAAGTVEESQVSGNYFFAKHNGTSWVVTELAESGTFLDDEPRGYVGGASLTDTSGEYYIATDLNTGNWHVYRGQVTAGVDGSLTQLSTGFSGEAKKFRPKVPNNANEHIPVVWIEGRYTTFLDYDTDLYAFVDVAETPATFTTQPVSTSAQELLSAEFTAAATAYRLPTLQWQSSIDGISWAGISGETSGTYTRSTVLADDGLLIRCLATNGAGSVASNTATLTVTSAPSLLLDLYPSATGYSLKKIRTAYGGNCVRVRRSSDNAEQDIGFNGLDIDSDALETFVGAGDGFIAKWYNQGTAGTARDGVQTIAVRQCRIAVSGSYLGYIQSLSTASDTDQNTDIAGWYGVSSEWVGAATVYALMTMPTSTYNFPSLLRGSFGINHSGSVRYRHGTLRSGITTVAAGTAATTLDTYIQRTTFANRLDDIVTRVNGTEDFRTADADADFLNTTSWIGIVGSERGNIAIREFVPYATNVEINLAAIESLQMSRWGITV